MSLVRLPSFISKAFLLTCYSIFVISALKYLSNNSNIYVISAWVSIDCPFPCEFRFSWFFVCQVILDYILYIQVTSFLSTVSPVHFSKASLFSTPTRKLGLYLPQFAHISHDCICVQVSNRRTEKRTKTMFTLPLKTTATSIKEKFSFLSEFQHSLDPHCCYCQCHYCHKTVQGLKYWIRKMFKKGGYLHPLLTLQDPSSAPLVRIRGLLLKFCLLQCPLLDFGLLQTQVKIQHEKKNGKSHCLLCSISNSGLIH